MVGSNRKFEFSALDTLQYNCLDDCAAISSRCVQVSSTVFQHFVPIYDWSVDTVFLASETAVPKYVLHPYACQRCSVNVLCKVSVQG